MQGQRMWAFIALVLSGGFIAVLAQAHPSATQAARPAASAMAPQQLSLQLSPTKGAKGTLVSATGTGFVAQEQFLVLFGTAQSGSRVATGTAAGNGSIAATFAVPPGTTTGAHRVTVVGMTSGFYASAAFTVLPGQATATPTTTGTNTPIGGTPTNTPTPTNTVTNDSWAQLDYDQSHDSNSLTAHGVCTSTDTLSPLYQLTVSPPMANFPPVTWGNTVFISTQHGVSSIMLRPRLHVNWNYSTGAAVTTSPAVDNYTAYVGAGNTVFAVDVVYGTLSWSYNIGLPVTGVSVYGSVVYVTGGAANGASGVIVAIDQKNPKTYSVLWTYSVSNSIDYPPAIGNTMIYVNVRNRGLSAIDLSTGQFVWGYGMIVAFTSGPSTAGGLVFSGAPTGQIIAVNGATGKLVWNTTLTGQIPTGAPSVANTMIYIPTRDITGTGGFTLFAYNIANGAFKWKQDFSLNIYGSPAAGCGLLYVSAGFQVYALQGSDGTQVWSGAQLSGSTVSPILTLGGLIVEDTQHNILWYVTPNGKMPGERY